MLDENYCSVDTNQNKYFEVDKYVKWYILLCLFSLQRKQKDVQKDNEFYFHLIQQALPPELQNAEKQKGNI